jgi:hypothetical protein
MELWCHGAAEWWERRGYLIRQSVSDTDLVLAALLYDAIEDSEVPRELIAKTSAKMSLPSLWRSRTTKVYRRLRKVAAGLRGVNQRNPSTPALLGRRPFNCMAKNGRIF